MTSATWTLASCKGRDPELWFPETIADARRATRICDECPIKGFCFGFAVKNDMIGIWGGQALGISVEDKQGSRLQAAIGVYCKNGHKYDGLRGVSGSNGQKTARTCSTCNHKKKKRQSGRRIGLTTPEEVAARHKIVVGLLEAGMSPREVAAKLNLNIKTVQRHQKEWRRDVNGSR
jgi:transposase-like protein